MYVCMYIKVSLSVKNIKESIGFFWGNVLFFSLSLFSFSDFDSVCDSVAIYSAFSILSVLWYKVFSLSEKGTVIYHNAHNNLDCYLGLTVSVLYHAM